MLRSFTHSARALTVLSAGLLLALGIVAAPGRASAQDMAMTPHPAHIHSGSCATLGDVVYPLTDVGGMAMGTPTAGDMMGTPEMGEMMASPTSMDAMSGDMAMASPSPMAGEMSVTTVDVALSDLTAGDYAINVHESAENIGNYIACGDLKGATGGTDVTIDLATLNDSGYSGTAMLHDNGDGTTTVTINLMHEGM